MQTRPIELVNASKACAEAWARRDESLENQPELLGEMNKVCEEMDMRYSSLYRQWQILGGTSDIESIVEVFLLGSDTSDPRTVAETEADAPANFVQQAEKWNAAQNVKRAVIDCQHTRTYATLRGMKCRDCPVTLEPSDDFEKSLVARLTPRRSDYVNYR